MILKKFQSQYTTSHIVLWQKHLLLWDFADVDTKTFYDLVKYFENDINEISLCYPMHTIFDPLNTLKSLKDFENYCKIKNIKCNFITGAGHKYHSQEFKNDLSNFYEWQGYFFTKTLVNDTLPAIGHNKNIGKLFTCLNNHSRRNRCIFLDYLAKHKLIESNYVSWHDTQQGNYCYPNNGYKFTWWRPKNLVLEETWTDIQTVWNTPDLTTDYFIPPVTCWKDSLFSVITESQVPETFITEKTALAINHLRPFVVYSSTYFHQSLKDLGFRLFDNVIDYSFDIEPDENKRAEMIVKQLVNLRNQDFSVLKKLVYENTLENFRQIKKFKKIQSIPVAIQPLIESFMRKDLITMNDTNNFLSIVRLLQQNA